MHASPFSLVKWYLDCVTDDGDVVMVYCAELRWRRLHAKICSLLLGNEKRVGTQTSVSGYRVSRDASLISAELPKLGVSGRWVAGEIPFERTVYESVAGRVQWNCLQPRSDVHVRVADRELHGIGYAECLTLTIPPWQLPMRTLRWGRFASSDHSLAWVDWHGQFSTSLAVLDGKECKPLTVSESRVNVPGADLRIEPGLSLRSGRLGATILPGASRLVDLFPSSIFNVDEHKWRSRGALTLNGPKDSGWVIHEVVQWKP